MKCVWPGYECRRRRLAIHVEPFRSPLEQYNSKNISESPMKTSKRSREIELSTDVVVYYGSLKVSHHRDISLPFLFEPEPSLHLDHKDTMIITEYSSIAKNWTCTVYTEHGPDP